MTKRKTALQKAIINICKSQGKVTPKIVKSQYDECYKTIRENMLQLEEESVLKRTHERKLEFTT